MPIVEHRVLDGGKPNGRAFPENETDCYGNVSAMDMEKSRNAIVTITVGLQCALGANGFGSNRELVIARIFDMLQRQSLRGDRSCGTFPQWSRHFPREPIKRPFADADLHATVDERPHHIAGEGVRDDREADEA